MRVLAIDRELEHFLRVIVPEYMQLPEKPENHTWYDTQHDKICERYNLDNGEFYGDSVEWMEAILRAQIQAEVV